MKQNKNLILLCDTYPLSAGEFFLDDEIRIIHPYFEKIYVLVKEQEIKQLNRFVPQNLEVITYNPEISSKSKLKAIPKIFSALFISELFLAIFKFKIKPSTLLFKIMFMDIAKSNIILKELNALINNKGLNIADTVFYSYWHDYRALAIAHFVKENKNTVAISRAHSSDIFVERNIIPYLPFKTFIINNLSRTLSISELGKEYLFKKYKVKTIDRIEVSRLGKTNNRLPNQIKQTEEIIICSCSHFNNTKRVHLIVDILSELKDLKINWVHFGWGPKEKDVKERINKIYPDLNFKFMGQICNEKILDFYADNYIDLFLNVSESEGIPVSIMEALSAGIPVVATNVGGTREAVPAEVGFLLKKDFDVKYAANLIRLYFNLTKQEQETYRKNAFSFWHENFNAEKNYSAFAQLLQNL